LDGVRSDPVDLGSELAWLDIGGVFSFFGFIGDDDLLLFFQGSYRKILARQTWMPLSYFRNQFAAMYISVSLGFSSC
jgi:hypothetical protein